MVLQELEAELSQIEAQKAGLTRLHGLERQCIRLDSEIAYQQTVLKSLQHTEDHPKRHGTTGVTAREAAQIDHAKVEVKRKLDELKTAMKSAGNELTKLEYDIDRSFNRYWGPIFREGTENTRFAEQVESYACVYTSRVSNFLAYSPLRHFRTPRAQLPHELV